jgi:beta-phosphoglucomutase-like phosphatase (HAD superfamily)
MIKAIIFDLDEVIIRSQKLHYEVEFRILSEERINIPPEKITFRWKMESKFSWTS